MRSYQTVEKITLEPKRINQWTSEFWLEVAGLARVHGRSKALQLAKKHWLDDYFPAFLAIEHMI